MRIINSILGSIISITITSIRAIGPYTPPANIHIEQTGRTHALTTALLTGTRSVESISTASQTQLTIHPLPTGPLAEHAGTAGEVEVLLLHFPNVHVFERGTQVGPCLSDEG